jgi:hypothetical protein
MRKIVDDNKYDVATQPNDTASIENSLPIVGRAILIDDAIKGVRNEDTIALNNAIFLFESLFI